jgi:hypothetical protein
MAARAAARKATALPVPEPGEMSIHEEHTAAGHHWHVESNWTVCSCGDPRTTGVFTVSVDSRYWSEDPAELAAVQREEADFEAWISCMHCGKRGVIADDVFGVWPPRTLG